MTQFHSSDLDIIRNGLDSVTDIMSLTLVRTARSTIVRQGWDFSTAILSSDGELVGQGVSQPLHLAGMMPALEACTQRYKNDIYPGDILANNDPYEGGSHLPDIFLFKPVYLENKLLGFCAAMCHHTDIGGRMPGGQSPDSTEIYQEGLRIPPLKLYHRGQPNETLFRLIEKAVRTPEEVLGDIQAQLASLYSGETELTRFITKMGIEGYQLAIKELINYTERRTRQFLSNLPDGTWTFTDQLDNDGITDNTIYIVATVNIKGSNLNVDFTGSSPQSKGAIQGVFSSMVGMVYIVLKSIIGNDVPSTSGMLRPISVTAPPGSIVNPQLPAPVACRYMVARVITHALWGVFAQIAPEKAMGCPGGSMAFLYLSGYDKTKIPWKSWILMDCSIGIEIAMGGRSDKDGIDAQCTNVTQLAQIPAEVLELEFPLKIEEHAIRPDSEGPGKYRGGLGISRQWEILSEDTLTQICSDRFKQPPWGVKGGLSAATPLFTVTDNKGIKSQLPGKHTFTTTTGNIVRAEVSGAGGYGPPSERSPELVLWDVREEKVSITRAADIYGVAINIDTKTIDWLTTARLRSTMQETLQD